MAIAGIILAAGRSTRLGRPKQLLPLGERPLLAHTLAHAVASRLDDVILVLGHDAEAIAAAVGEHGQRTVINSDYAAGQSTSVRAGLTALAPDTEAVLFLLGDQPAVTAEIIDTIVAAYRATPSLILVPVYSSERGNPVLFDHALFPEFATVSGDEGARTIVRAHAADVRLIPVPGDHVPHDVDTEEDYQRLLASWPGT